MPHITNRVGTTLRITATCAVLFILGVDPVRAQPKIDDSAPSEDALRRRLEPLVPSVRAALQGDDVDAQRAALAILPDFPAGLLKEARLAPAVATYLQRDLKDPELIALGLRSYGKIRPDASTIKQVVGRHVTSGHAVVRKAAGESLTMALQSAVPSAGRSVVNAAEFIDLARSAVPLLGEGLGDADAEVQRAALDGVQTAARVVTDVYQYEIGPGADDTKPKVNNGQLGPLAPVVKDLAAVVPKISAPLSAPDVPTRLAAARALETLAALRRVIGALRGPDADPFAEIGRTLLPVVTARMADQSPDVRLAMTEALEALGDALEARQLLRTGTTDRNTFVRWAAARAIGRAAPAKPDPTVVAPDIAALVRLVGDPDLDVRSAALTALSRFGPAARSATPAVLDAATRGDVEPRTAAIKALGALESPADVTLPVLIAGLDHRDVRLQTAAAAGLVRFGPEARPALPGLRKAATSTDPDLRLAAAEAILAIDRKPRLKDL